MFQSKLSRREFNGQLAKSAMMLRLAMLAELGGAGILLGGCGLAQDIEDFVPIAKASLASIELELTTNGIKVPPIVTDIGAALDALKAAAVEYGAVTPSPVTAIQKLQDAIKAVTDQLQAFLAALNIPAGTTLTLIIGLAQIIISTVMAFLNRVPPPPPAVKVATIAVRWRVSGAEFNVAPHERDKHQFRGDWNKELDYGAKHGVLCPKAAYI